jgi:hypothetical protein
MQDWLASLRALRHQLQNRDAGRETYPPTKTLLQTLQQWHHSI